MRIVIGAFPLSLLLPLLPLSILHLCIAQFYFLFSSSSISGVQGFSPSNPTGANTRIISLRLHSSSNTNSDSPNVVNPANKDVPSKENIHQVNRPGYISSPMTRQDFRQVSELLYDCFDEQASLSSSSSSSLPAQPQEVKGLLAKSLYEIKRMLGIFRLEQDYSLRAAQANRYTTTSGKGGQRRRTRQQRKYAQIVYRDSIDGSILGVAEVGIAQLPVPVSNPLPSASASASGSKSKLEAEVEAELDYVSEVEFDSKVSSRDNHSDSNPPPVRRVPTLGNLAVKKDARRQGIATELLDKCEEIVFRRWNDTELFVAVETESPARALYQDKCGYNLFNGEEIVKIPIRQGFFGEDYRNHIIYHKNVDDTSHDQEKLVSKSKEKKEVE